MKEISELPRQLFCTKKDRLLSSTVFKQKGLEWAGKELSRRRYQKFSRLSYAANCVRISENNLTEIYTVINDIAQVAGFTVSEVYLLNSPQVNVFMVGEVDPFMVITSQAVSLLSLQQLKVLIAQSMVHLHCEHMACFMLKDLLASTADNAGVFKSVIALPRMLLEEWFVEAQISADRGTLYLLNDIDLILDTYSAIITGGVGEQGRDIILQEYKKFNNISADVPVCPLFKTWSDLYLSNERYIYRSGKLYEYSQSEEYEKILTGNYNDLNDCKDDITEDDACAYWDGFNGRGGVWEAEDVHEQMAFGFTNIQSTADFIKMYAGDVLKFGVDSASKVTSNVLAGLSDLLAGQNKKD